MQSQHLTPSTCSVEMSYHEMSLTKFLLSEIPASASKMELKDVVMKSEETTASSV